MSTEDCARCRRARGELTRARSDHAGLARKLAIKDAAGRGITDEDRAKLAAAKAHVQKILDFDHDCATMTQSQLTTEEIA